MEKLTESIIIKKYANEIEILKKIYLKEYANSVVNSDFLLAYKLLIEKRNTAEAVSKGTGLERSVIDYLKQNMEDNIEGINPIHFELNSHLIKPEKSSTEERLHKIESFVQSAKKVTEIHKDFEPIDLLNEDGRAALEKLYHTKLTVFKEKLKEFDKELFDLSQYKLANVKIKDSYKNYIIEGNKQIRKLGNWVPCYLRIIGDFAIMIDKETEETLPKIRIDLLDIE